MALIKCPECGAEISEKAIHCPSCGTPINNSANKKFCQHCGEQIDKDCVICPKCGKQVADLSQNNPDNSSPIIINNNNSASSSASSASNSAGGGPGMMGYPVGRPVNKVVYCLLALFLGGLGIHKFYAGKTMLGIIYLVFCCTGIPAIVALIEFILALLKPADMNGNIWL